MVFPDPIPKILEGPTAAIAERFFEPSSGLKPQTIRSYLASVLGFLKWCESTDIGAIADITRDDAMAWLGSFQSKRTQANRLAGAKAFFAYLADEGVCPNPFHKLKPPRIGEKQAPVVLSDHDLEQLIEACNGAGIVGKRDKVIIGLLLTALVRMPILIQLRIGDIQRSRGGRIQLMNKETGYQSLWPLTDLVQGWLEEYLEEIETDDGAAYLFQAKRGRAVSFSGDPLSEQSIRVRLWEYQDRAGAFTQGKLSARVIRDTGIKRYVDAGISAEHIQILAGQKSLVSTERYLAPLDQRILTMPQFPKLENPERVE